MDPLLLFGICVAIIVFLWVIGTPIYMSFLAGCLLFIVLCPRLTAVGLPHTLFGHLDIWVLLAMPLFILAGQIMAYTGAAQRLVDFMDCFVGWVPGGLWVVAAFSCMFFGTMCGSGPATTVAIGSVMLGALSEKGYSRGTSMGLIAACGTLGNLIPPSIGLILIGALTEQDVTVLFMGGLFPGIIIGVGLSILALFIARRRGYKGTHYTWGQRGRITLQAIPALITPVIILGGIYGGIFTPTEAAAVACVWSVVLSFIYRGATLARFDRALYESVRVTGALYLLITSALIFGFILVFLQLPQGLASWVVESGLSANMFMVVCWFMWMVLACFIDAGPILLISIPTFWPTVMTLGINQIHYSVFMQATIIAGQATPPFGVNLFAISSVAKAPVEEVYKGVIPFAILQGLVLLLILFFPAITLWLPGVLGAL